MKCSLTFYIIHTGNSLNLVLEFYYKENWMIGYFYINESSWYYSLTLYILLNECNKYENYNDTIAFGTVLQK